jgi:hypothetical protein
VFGTLVPRHHGRGRNVKRFSPLLHEENMDTVCTGPPSVPQVPRS